MLRKFNAFINKLNIPLSVINILVGILIGIAHVYIPFTSILGLVLGIVMSISGSVTMGISYFFTSKHSQEPVTDKAQPSEKPPTLENTTASNLFLGITLPFVFLTAAGSFFGMYTGILLLAAALTTPLAPAAIITIATVFALILAAGTLTNAWLQAHNIWESLKKPAAKREEKSSMELASKESTLKAMSMRKKKIPLQVHNWKKLTSKQTVHCSCMLYYHPPRLRFLYRRLHSSQHYLRRIHKGLRVN